MSLQLISRSPDLQRLQDEGFDIAIVDAFLVLRNVPYVNASREVKRGWLVSTLALTGEATTRPDTHVVYFAGEYPCDSEGQPLDRIRHQSETNTLHPQLVVQHSFSSKPHAGYADYYAKMTTYATILSSHAGALDKNALAQTRGVVEPAHEDSVFHYRDTASARAGISDLSPKLAQSKVAIVGLGGTGAYVLDLIAKTHVAEIHLFDSDNFLQHNAYRCPGAPSVDDLRRRPTKVDFLSEQYTRMRRGVIPHAILIDESTIHLLDGMDFVFLCIDRSSCKPAIAERLIANNVPFIDVGMGIVRGENGLTGILRVTTATPNRFEHVTSGRCVSLADTGGNDEYSSNIQVADLNALNAALAVVKWKKLCGFYVDIDQEHHCLYTIDGNDLQNGERF